MKELKIILLVLLIALPIWGIYRYVEAMTPVWQVAAAHQAAIDLQQAQQEAIVDATAHAQRTQDWSEIQRMFLIIVVCGVGGWLAVTIWAHYDKRQESWARPVDGQYALQQFNNEQVTWQVDMNKSVGGAIGFNKTAGLLGEFHSQTIGPDRQLTYAQDVQRTRTAAAVTGGDGFKYAATGKYLAGGYDKPFKPVEYPQLEASDGEPTAPWQPLTLQDAFIQSDRFNWILGQNQTSGATFAINPKNNAHFGIVGATGTGKTAYVGLLLMAYALKNRFRVVVLDGKGGADWSKFRHLVEYYSLDYSNVGELVRQMMNEYDKRQAVLNDAGANSIWELPSNVTKPRPTLFIIDEFGATMDSLKAANKTAYKAVELDLGNLLRLSRGAGMYVVLCDQNPTKWPGTVRANMPMNVCFRLGGNIGNAINEYNLDHLERVGHFQVGGTDYHAWPTFQEIDSVLANVEYKKPKALLTVQQELKLQHMALTVSDEQASTITGYKNREEGTGQKLTPKAITGSPVIDPHTRVTTPVTGADAPTKAVMTGKPVTAQDKAKILNIYAMTQSKSETCRLVWGGKNGQRMQWLNEILQGESAQ
ncbi:hypothetical protein BH10CHL1_BH10CHL1_01580 [soil metagenome]